MKSFKLTVQCVCALNKRADQIAKMREEREGEESEKREEREVARLRREVIGLIESGQLGKAMGRVTSFGLGDIEDPLIKQQLRDKFPQRSHPLPDSVTSINPIDSFRNLRESLLTLNHGTAPGSGGIRNEFLTVLGERMNDQQIKLLEDLGLI